MTLDDILWYLRLTTNLIFVCRSYMMNIYAEITYIAFKNHEPSTGIFLSQRDIIPLTT